MSDIDWDLVSRVAVPLLTAAAGAMLKDILERRPKVVCFYGYSAAVRVKTDATTVPVHTHSVVIANLGREVARNIRVGHYNLPAFEIAPDTEYKVQELPGGTQEILITQLAPKEQVTIHYLYYAPLTWDGVTSYVKSDSGLAKVLRTLPTPQLPRWIVMGVWALAAIGFTSIIYAAAIAFR